MKTVGFIGYKGHALRLMKIFQSLDGWRISHVYHPRKTLNSQQVAFDLPKDVVFTGDLHDLISCDAVVITSPNQTHFAYLKELAEVYQGYILCEKPPVSTVEELDALERLSDDFKGRLYFNFNMRTSWLRDQLDHIHAQYKLGEPVQISVVVGYGFAFKEAYRASWRSGKDFPAFGVLETLGIHYLDLLGLVYGRPGQGVCYARKLAPYAEAMDTCDFSTRLADRCVLNICCSYAIAFVNRFEVHYTDGRLVYNDGDLNVYGPRDSFSASGAFIAPPLQYHAAKPGTEIYTDSLERSCRHFAQHVRERKTFNRDLFDQSILSNRMCLSAKAL